MLSWNNHVWSFDKYDANMMKFKSIEKFATLSFKLMCKNGNTVWAHNDGREIKIRCLRDNSNCSATRELFTDGINSKRKMLFKNQCQFPFIHNHVKYDSCVKRKTEKHLDKFWCATTVDATNHKKTWGYCSDSCRLEEG